MEVSKNKKGRAACAVVDLIIFGSWADEWPGWLPLLECWRREPTEAIFIETSAIGAWDRAMSVPTGYVRLRVVSDLLGVEGKRGRGSR